MPNKYSFAEKKRIRNSFEKISSVMDFPDILEVQTNSYKEFLQSHLSPDERQKQGLHGVFHSIFPIISVSGNAKIEYLGYELDEPEFDVSECIARGTTSVSYTHLTLPTTLSV